MVVKNFEAVIKQKAQDINIIKDFANLNPLLGKIVLVFNYNEDPSVD